MAGERLLLVDDEDNLRSMLEAALRYEGFDVPYSTGSVGVIEGGIADNVVPEDCRFHYEFRNLPGSDVTTMQGEVRAYAETLEPAMRAIDADAGIRFETICEMPAFLAAADDPAVLLAQRLAATDATTLVAFGTEAGLFQRAGTPTVVDTTVTGADGSVSWIHPDTGVVTTTNDETRMSNQ